MGADAIVFSLLNALTLMPLPVSEPQRISVVNNTGKPAASFPDQRDRRACASRLPFLLPPAVSHVTAIDPEEQSLPLT